MGSFISKFLADRQVLMYELIPGKLEEQVSSGAIDFGITYLPIPRKDIEFIKVTTIEMAVYGREESFKNIEFSKLPFVVPIVPLEGVPHKVKGLDGWPDDRISRNIQFQVELMESALELCRQKVAVAYLPKFVVNLHNKQVQKKYLLQELGFPHKVKSLNQNVYIVKRKSERELPAFRKLAAALRRLK